VIKACDLYRIVKCRRLQLAESVGRMGRKGMHAEFWKMFAVFRVTKDGLRAENDSQNIQFGKFRYSVW
jgi:hypothetical protein